MEQVTFNDTQTLRKVRPAGSISGFKYVCPGTILKYTILVLRIPIFLILLSIICTVVDIADMRISSPASVNHQDVASSLTLSVTSLTAPLIVLFSAGASSDFGTGGFSR